MANYIPSVLQALQAKELKLYNKKEEHILAEAIGRRIFELERRKGPHAKEEIDILTSMMKRFGYRPATEEERYS